MFKSINVFPYTVFNSSLFYTIVNIKNVMLHTTETFSLGKNSLWTKLK